MKFTKMEREKKVKREILVTHEEILKRAEELGKQITKDYRDEEVILVGILRGCVPWIGDLMKNIDLPELKIDFMACSRYGSSKKTSGAVKILKDMNEDVSDKNIIIVEDIIDSGTTLNYLKGYLKNRGAKDVKVCSLLDKPEGRKIDIQGDYVGFTVGNRFIVGYGLDFDQKFRNLPYISCLD